MVCPDIVKIDLGTSGILTLEVYDYEEPFFTFGKPAAYPGNDFSGDDYQAEVHIGSRGAVWWRLRYWRSGETTGRLSPVKYGTPGDVVAGRIGGCRAAIRAVNDNLTKRWPWLLKGSAA